MNGTSKWTKAHCNACGRPTNHAVLHAEKTEGVEFIDEERGVTIDWWDRYEMIRCGGCDTIRMRHTSYFSEGDGEPTVVYYPPAISRRHPHGSMDQKASSAFRGQSMT